MSWSWQLAPNVYKRAVNRIRTYLLYQKYFYVNYLQQSTFKAIASINSALQDASLYYGIHLITFALIFQKDF